MRAPRTFLPPQTFLATAPAWVCGATAPTMFALRVGIEYQRSSNNQIPYGFQLLLHGDLDLLKALQGGHAETPPPQRRR